MKILFLDDDESRWALFWRANYEGNIIHWAKTAEEARLLLQAQVEPYDFATLDHDLAAEHYTDQNASVSTGQEVASFIAAMPVDRRPKRVELHIKPKHRRESHARHPGGRGSRGPVEPVQREESPVSEDKDVSRLTLKRHLLDTLKQWPKTFKRVYLHPVSVLVTLACLVAYAALPPHTIRSFLGWTAFLLVGQAVFTFLMAASDVVDQARDANFETMARIADERSEMLAKAFALNAELVTRLRQLDPALDAELKEHAAKLGGVS